MKKLMLSAVAWRAEYMTAAPNRRPMIDEKFILNYPPFSEHFAKVDIG
jgi:hypothetical protein